MAFPLTGNPLTAAGVTVAVPDLAQPVATITPTLMWSQRFTGNLYPTMRSTSGLTVAVPDLMTPYTTAVGSRYWGGIGLTVVRSSQGWASVT